MGMNCSDLHKATLKNLELLTGETQFAGWELMRKQTQDVIVMGLALFAMFFGAGNLIFPVYLGKIYGSNFLPAILGFVLTATGLPLLGIFAGVKARGSANVVSALDRRFAMCISIASLLCIGPLFAIPRTAATTYEIAVRQFIPERYCIVFYCLYFIVNVIFVMKPSAIVDVIGRILTPVLLISVGVLIVKGIFNPVAKPIDTDSVNVLSRSLLEGYQTMDGLGALVLSNIVLSTTIQKGYKEKGQIRNLVVKSGIIAVGALAIVYGGLVYMGAQMSGIVPGDIEKVQLVIEVAQRILGEKGSLILGICISLACLTTAIGLSSTVASCFERLTRGKMKYSTNVVWISALSIGIATLGVDKIVNLAVPVLGILYPVVIVLILTTVLSRFMKDDRVIAGTVYTAFIVSFVDTLNIFGLRRFTSLLPFASDGFAWIVPAVCVFVLITLEYVLGVGHKLHPVKRSSSH